MCLSARQYRNTFSLLLEVVCNFCSLSIFESTGIQIRKGCDNMVNALVGVPPMAFKNYTLMSSPHCVNLSHTLTHC